MGGGAWKIATWRSKYHWPNLTIDHLEKNWNFLYCPQSNPKSWTEFSKCSSYTLPLKSWYISIRKSEKRGSVNVSTHIVNTRIRAVRIAAIRKGETITIIFIDETGQEDAKWKDEENNKNINLYGVILS